MAAVKKAEIVYPDSDGKPMADNTKQFEAIVYLKKGFDVLFHDDPNVFVAGDLLWYPVEGKPKVRRAPDTMIVFGRPKGHRGSYMQWREAGVGPQVVFEVLSPGNDEPEMARRFQFYQRYGVEEYYIFDPDAGTLVGYHRGKRDRLTTIPDLQNWVSPRLQVFFRVAGDRLTVIRTDGRTFLTVEEWALALKEVQRQLDHERQRADQERQRAERAEAQLAEQMRRIAELEARLRKK